MFQTSLLDNSIKIGKLKYSGYVRLLLDGLVPLHICLLFDQCCNRGCTKIFDENALEIRRSVVAKNLKLHLSAHPLAGEIKIILAKSILWKPNYFKGH